VRWCEAHRIDADRHHDATASATRHDHEKHEGDETADDATLPQTHSCLLGAEERREKEQGVVREDDRAP
jgi:hypothetical protein